MWLVCAVISVLFSVFHLILTAEHAKWTWFCGVGAMVFIILSLLIEEYRIILWIQAEDWVSLTETVPYQHMTMTAYAILVVVANIILMTVNRAEEKRKSS